MATETPDKKELVKEAAIAVFSEKGFYAANMREIAARAGVAIGTIYHYFLSKEDLLIYIVTSEIEERKKFFEQLRESGLPLSEQIRQILAMNFERIREQKELVKVFIRERLNPEKAFEDRIHALFEDLVGYIKELIEEAIARGEIRACDPLTVAYATLGATEAIITRGVFHEDEIAERILKNAPEELADYIWRGLGREQEG